MVTRAESLEVEQASLLTKLFQKNLLHCRPCLWNIPAYAGKTWRGRCSCHCRTEHPRVCGENADDKILAALEGGTSPRMRGKPAEKVTVQELKRNIPAYAGKTTIARCLACCHQEHPRVCGENMQVFSSYRPSYGTSPRMRGKRNNRQKRLNQARNIPAYAGKTFSGSSSQR